MNFTIYFILTVLLIILLLCYYYLQKPKKTNIEETYSKYLLRSTNPDVAFTYKRLPNGNYINYYLNYDSSVPEMLTKVESAYPVTSTGADYKPNEHGTLIENDSGFRITGCDAEFVCPNNWFWNKTTKCCNLKPLCNNEDTGIIKGLDEYHFKSSEIQDKLPKLSNINSVKFHDKLYVECLDDGDFLLKECEFNTIYNQEESQVSNNPCLKYDVCEDLREYSIHKFPFDDTQLKDNEYYICIDSKSVLKTCKTDSVFNTSLNACIEINKCALKENGYTFENTANSYILCNNGEEFVVNCSNGLYFGNGKDKLVCKIDSSKSYKDYFTNAHISMPISLYLYQNNQEIEYSAITGSFTKQMALLPDESGFFKGTRNTYLFTPVTFNSYFVAYVDENTKEEATSVLLTYLNYEQFATSPTLNVSYYDIALEIFKWNIFKDMPESDIDIFYKYDTVIKHSNDSNVSLPSVEYFYFIKAVELYKPKTIMLNHVYDNNTGILYYADFSVPASLTIPNPTLTLAYKVLNYTITSDNKYIFYYVDPVLSNLIAIVWSETVVVPDCFTDDPDNPGFIIPTLYNVPSIQPLNSTSFHLRLSSLTWYGSVSGEKNYVIPEFLSCISFSSYQQLDKQFTILDYELLSDKTDLTSFKQRVDSLYDPASLLIGNYTDLEKTQTSINSLFLDKYVLNNPL